MFVAHDQENLVHAHQTAAAAKPLNQGIKGYGAKTPGNRVPKTPFKIPLNDENATFRAGKSILRTNGKHNENQFLKAGKGGPELAKSAFVTPAGPRNRAPLGMKTTNAKATAFLTPAPLTVEPGTEKSLKTRSPRIRRAKVRVHQAGNGKENAEDDVPDIEYMPPRGTPLADHPEDVFPSDMEYPMFEGRSKYRGIWSTYINPVGEDGMTLFQRREAERDAELEREVEAQIQASLDEIGTSLIASHKKEQDARDETVKPKHSAPGSRPAPKLPQPRAAAAPAIKPAFPHPKGPSTATSRSAASALAPTSGKESFLAPTASTRAKAPTSAPPTRKKAMVTSKPPALSTMRHTAATAASKTTLGYSRGRAASSTLRQPLAGLYDPARQPSTNGNISHRRAVSTPAGLPVRTEPPSIGKQVKDTSYHVMGHSGAELELQQELRMRDLRIEEEGEFDDTLGFGAPCLRSEEVLEDFVLEMPNW